MSALGNGIDTLIRVDPASGCVVEVRRGIGATAAGLCDVSVAEDEMRVTTDSGGVYAIFGDEQRGVFSSALCEVLGGGRYAVDRQALMEQLITGSVSGGRTCFAGISRYDGMRTVRLGNTRLCFVRPEQPPTTPEPTSLQSCMEYQLQVLRSYFARIGDTVAGPVSMGLSGGYDSRLMLLLAREVGLDVRPYTYAGRGHAAERTVAADVARMAGCELRAVPLRLTDELDDISLEKNVQDALSYYDGRTNDTMGSFGDVHTSRVQRECVGACVLNLNGLGGELYRNRERLPRGYFAFSDWFWHYVVGPRAAQAFVSSKAAISFERHMAAKYGEILGLGPLRRLDRAAARRWFRQIWLPDFAGPRLSAENRVGPAVMPFADGRVSAAALAVTPFVGSNGEFEARMIRQLDAKVAGVGSCYGRDFATTRLGDRMVDSLLAGTPVRLRRVRGTAIARRSTYGGAPARGWSARFGEAMALVQKLDLGLDLDRLSAHQVTRDRLIYVAELLYRHRENLVLTD